MICKATSFWDFLRVRQFHVSYSLKQYILVIAWSSYVPFALAQRNGQQLIFLLPGSSIKIPSLVAIFVGHLRIPWRLSSFHLFIHTTPYIFVRIISSSAISSLSSTFHFRPFFAESGSVWTRIFRHFQILLPDCLIFSPRWSFLRQTPDYQSKQKYCASGQTHGNFSSWKCCQSWWGSALVCLENVTR